MPRCWAMRCGNIDDPRSSKDHMQTPTTTERSYLPTRVELDMVAGVEMDTLLRQSTLKLNAHVLPKTFIPTQSSIGLR